MEKIKFLLFIAMLLLGTGCKQNSAQPQAGTYQGNLILGSTNYAVAAVLTNLPQGGFHLEIQGFPQFQSSVDVTTLTVDQTISVDLKQAAFPRQTLQLGSTCYKDLGTGANLQICAKSDSIQIQATSADLKNVYSLSLEFFGDVANGIQLETPQNYTLDQAVALAMAKEFNTEIEFQHMLQAHYNAQQSLNELLPSLNGGVLTSLASGPLSVLGALALSENIAPFLFPSNWLEAKASGVLSTAENDALALMKGSAGLQVETMAYSIDHDIQALANLNQVADDLSNLLPQVQDQENKNLVPAGTFQHLESIENALHDKMDDVTEGLNFQQAAMAQAMGLINPAAVETVSVPSFPTHVNTDNDLELGQLQQLVLDRSMELRQMDNLISAAQLGLKADYFSWLDPAADVAHSLGFGSGQTLQIDQSNIAQLNVQRSQVASTLLQNLDSAIIQYNHSLDDLADSKSGIKLEQERWAELKAQLSAGQAVSATEITSAPNDLLLWEINLLDAELEYRSSKARLERLLLQGYYSQLDGATNSGPYLAL